MNNEKGIYLFHQNIVPVSGSSKVIVLFPYNQIYFYILYKERKSEKSKSASRILRDRSKTS